MTRLGWPWCERNEDAVDGRRGRIRWEDERRRRMDDGMRRSITAAAGDDCRVGRFLRFPGRQFPFLRDAAPFPSRFTSIVGYV